MGLKFSLSDTQGIRKKIQALSRAMPDITSGALLKEAEIEATESKRRTPVDLGNLRASIHVEGPEIDSKGNVSAAIVAGGPSAPYALIVHEDLDAYHKVGQAKFIESTLKESAPFLPARIASRVRDMIMKKAR